MKKILILILALSLCIGLVGCKEKKDDPTTDSTADDPVADTNPDESGDDGEADDDKTPDKETPPAGKTVAIACSYDTNKYDVAELVGGTQHRIIKDGKEVEGSVVSLDVGVNVFNVVYKVSVVERMSEVRIARRAEYRVVFNTNGGNYIDNRYVEDGAVINDSDVVPTRERYTFAGWYNEKGQEVTLANTPIVEDTTFIAHWEGPNNFELPSQTAVTYETSSALLNIVWKDYDNAFALRPDSVLCTLKNTKTDVSYSVKVTKNSAEFVGVSPDGASISQSAGNWTVKITGLTDDYTFTQDDFENEDYTSVQGGTTIINTMNDYDPLYDETSALRTQNGRFYDLAGNVIVLRGVVPWNIDAKEFAKSTGTLSLERLKAEGCNVIRITVPLGATTGYQNIDQDKRNAYITNMKLAVERASSLGMYCIVDWGVMHQKKKDDDNRTSAQINNEYLQGLLEPAKEFFGAMSSACADNPYIIYELANEPTASWSVLKDWEESLIRHIRSISPYATIIAAPTNHSRYISDNTPAKGDDPIDDPFSTEIAYNIAHTFHCYAYTTTYNVDYADEYREDAVYGWRVCDAVKNGLTVVVTEFSPANANMKYVGGVDPYGLDADYMEANKWLNFMLENDVNCTMFRFGDIPDGADKVKAQFMFIKEYEEEANRGTWTYDMLTDSGKWYYDNVFNATGFIKAADFDYKFDYASATPTTSPDATTDA